MDFWLVSHRDAKVNYWIYNHLIALGLSDGAAVVVKILIFVFAALLISYLTNYITKRFIVRVLEAIIRNSKTIYDDFFLEHKVFQRLSHLAPAAVVYFLTIIFLADYPAVSDFLKNTMLVYFTIV